MYYLILSEDVGPNQQNSLGMWKGDQSEMRITTEPGRGNMDKKIYTEGWLGTTCDQALYAYGEYETIEAAREVANGMGYTEPREDDQDQYYGIVEKWITPEAAREQWDAGDWFINGIGSSDAVRAQFGITANTTDNELDEIITAEEKYANGENVELHGTRSLFYSLRDELVDELDD